MSYVQEDYYWGTHERLRLDTAALRHAIEDAVSRLHDPTTDEEAEQRALSLNGAGLAAHFRDKRDMERARAEKAEQERDEARQALTEVAQGGELTPRELMDAAWDRAYVPEDGVIPANTPFLNKFCGEVNGPHTISVTMTANDEQHGAERRLLDPPAPKRPEGAESIETALTEATDELAWQVSQPTDIPALADALASRGVRVTTEDGAA